MCEHMSGEAQPKQALLPHTDFNGQASLSVAVMLRERWRVGHVRLRSMMQEFTQKPHSDETKHKKNIILTQQKKSSSKVNITHKTFYTFIPLNTS